MDIHNSVMEIRDLRYKYLTAIIYIHHWIMAAHNAKLYGTELLIARPKDGLFRLHASWIYLSYAGFDCLAAILCH